MKFHITEAVILSSDDTRKRVAMYDSSTDILEWFVPIETIWPGKMSQHNLKKKKKKKKKSKKEIDTLGRVKRIWYLSPTRAAKVPESPLLAHISSESRGAFRQKARSLPPLNGWACAVKIWHDGMLEDTNSLDAPHSWIKLESIFKLVVSAGKLDDRLIESD